MSKPETTQHKQSEFQWVRVGYASGEKTFLSVYVAPGTRVHIEHLDYPHHSENSEWKGVDIFVYNQTTFHNFHDARAKEIDDAA
jgi:hypothetical protein